MSFIQIKKSSGRIKLINSDYIKSVDIVPATNDIPEYILVTWFDNTFEEFHIKNKVKFLNLL